MIRNVPASKDGVEEGRRGWFLADDALGATVAGNGGELREAQEKFWTGWLTLMQAQYVARPRQTRAKRMTAAQEA